MLESHECSKHLSFNKNNNNINNVILIQVKIVQQKLLSIKDLSKIYISC